MSSLTKEISPRLQQVHEMDSKVSKFYVTKENVLMELDELMKNCDRIVIKQLNDELKRKYLDMIKNGFFICLGIATIIVPACGLALGGAGMAVCLIVIGAKMYLVKKSSEAKVNAMEEILEKLRQTVTEYREALQAAYIELERFEEFKPEVFLQSIDNIDDIVRDVQKESQERFPKTREFLARCERIYRDFESFIDKVIPRNLDIQTEGKPKINLSYLPMPKVVHVYY